MNETTPNSGPSEAGSPISLPALKRIIERLQGDGELRERCLENPTELEALIREHDLDIDPDLLFPLWSHETPRDQLERARQAPELAPWWERRAARRAYLDGVIALPDGAPPVYRDWRRRQMARCQLELSSHLNGILPHASLAIELSKGCSVGCWFCGISADRFGGYFEYSEDNVRLWRGVLEALEEVVGVGMRSASLYWATDATDNPDYEKFARDYFHLTGHLPQTTTARPVQDVEWTRRTLALRRELDAPGVDRFSILSTRDLRKVHEELSPEELMDVEIVFQNKGALGEERTKVEAGRATAVNRKASGKPKTFSEHQETIACVSGFLVNMVERRIRLISPCRASEHWPDGFRVYAEATFESAEHLREILSDWQTDILGRDALDAPRIAFHRDAEYERTENGFLLRTRLKERRVEGLPELQFLGDRIVEGRWTRAQILDQGSREGFELLRLVSVLGQLAGHGFLDDDPRAFEEGSPLECVEATG